MEWHKFNLKEHENILDGLNLYLGSDDNAYIIFGDDWYSKLGDEANANLHDIMHGGIICDGDKAYIVPKGCTDTDNAPYVVAYAFEKEAASLISESMYAELKKEAVLQ